MEHRYGDVSLKVWITDPVAEEWYDHDWNELEEISLLKRHAALVGGGLRPGARVFDLGAHQGVVAVILEAAVAPGGNVVAVEARQENVEVGRAILKENGYSNVDFIYGAAGAKPGVIYFNENFNGQVDWGRLPRPG